MSSSSAAPPRSGGLIIRTEVLPPEVVHLDGYEPGHVVYNDLPPPGADTPTPPHGRLVMKRTSISQIPATPSTLAPSGSFADLSRRGKPQPGRRVLLARPIAPGQTVHFRTSPDKAAAFPQLLHADVEPENVVTRLPPGPRRDALGSIVPHTLVGTVDDYESHEHHLDGTDRLAPLQIGGGKRDSLLPPALASAQRRSPSSSPTRRQKELSAHGFAATGGRASADEPAAEPSSAERVAAQFEKVWRAQRRRLARQTGRPEAELMMSAPPDQKYIETKPWIPPSSWSHSLRDANETHVAVGSRMSGLFMTVRHAPRPPDDEYYASQRAGGLQPAQGAEGGADAAARERADAADARADADADVGAGGGAPHHDGAFASPSAHAGPPDTAASHAEPQRVAYFEQSKLVEGSVVPVDMAASRPAVELATRRLVLSAQPGVRATAHATVTNSGTTALAFAWHVVEGGAAGAAPPGTPRDAPPGAAAAAALAPPTPRGSADGRARFFAPLPSGALLPGESRSLPVGFVSPNAGVFTARWVLHTVPPLPDAELPALELRALCAEPPPTALPARAAAVRAQLAASELDSFVRDLLARELVGRAIVLAESHALDQTVALAARDRAAESAAPRAAFESANADLGLSFTQPEFARLHELSQKVLGGSKWDLRVLTLEEALTRQQTGMGADESAALADELCELVARCSVPPPRAPEHPSAWAVTWHAVAALAEALVDTADGARGALGLRPRVGRYPSRPPTPPDHLQRGRAAQAAQAEEAEEAADGAEAEAAPEAEGGAPDGAHAVPAAGTATATAAEADHAARMELFAVIERRRARIAELRAQLDSLPAAKPSAVRKALGACGLKPDPGSGPNGAKEQLRAVVSHELASESETLAEEESRLFPRCPPPPPGQPLLREGQWWHFDWAERAYVLAPPAEGEARDARALPPGDGGKEARAVVEARVRALVVDVVERLDTSLSRLAPPTAGE